MSSPTKLGCEYRTDENIAVQHAHALQVDAVRTWWQQLDAEVAAGRDPYPATPGDWWIELDADVWRTALEARRNGATIASLCRALDWTPGIVKRELRVAAGVSSRDAI